MRLIDGRWIHQCPNCSLLWAVEPPGSEFLCSTKTEDDPGCKQTSTLEWPENHEEIFALHQESGQIWHPLWNLDEYRAVIEDPNHEVGV